jgi:hypothetical protein
VLTRKISQRPSGIFTCVSRLCLQGGGVAVVGGTVAISLCTISGITASYVRDHFKSSHRPYGDFDGDSHVSRFVLAG